MDYKDLLKYLNEITVLYVEDDIDIREELEFFLKKRVSKLYIAKNGEEGYETYIKVNPDLVITDIQMPKMNGIDMSKLIKDYNPSSNIVIITAFNDTKFLFDSIELNINSYLTKPLNLQNLLVTIGKIAKNIFLEKENKQIYNTLEQYKNLVDERSIFIKFDTNSFITYANEMFEKVSGYSLDEIIENEYTVSDCLIKDNSIITTMWDKTRNKKEIWQDIIVNISKNQKKYYLDTIVKPILDLNGEVIEYISLSNDITDIEQTKIYFKNQTEIKAKDLSESIRISEFYKNAINKSNIILKFNRKKQFIYANKLFYDISGYKEEELIGKDYSFLKQVNTNNKKLSDDEEIFLDKVWEGKIINISKDGNRFYNKITCLPFKDVEGNIIEYLQIRQDITKIENLHRELNETQREIIYKLGEIAETRSNEVGNHVKRVAEYSKLIAEKYGLSEKEIDTIFLVSPMHDIGKIAIPDEVLNKPGKLNSYEWEIMKTHSEIGYDILKNSNRDMFKYGAIVAYTHHEKWNGTGYPLGLKGEEIHIFGRITAVADVFDALGTKRIYKDGWQLEDIIKYFKDESGKHFDPELIDILINNLDEFLLIRDKYKD